MRDRVFMVLRALGVIIVLVFMIVSIYHSNWPEAIFWLLVILGVRLTDMRDSLLNVERNTRRRHGKV